MNNLFDTLKKSIEIDDLNTFKNHFDISMWKQSITQIENYAGVSKYTPEITYNDCDVLKYSLHCESDNIFNYLLPQLDTNKYGDNYGWPLLAMAIKLNRYDYANAILNHPSFNPYPLYHTNQFGFIETKENEKKHIDFLFNYLDKFDKFDFKDSQLLYVFTHLICFNEETFQRFNSFYQNKFNCPDFCALSLFEDNWKKLGQEVFYNYFRKFILDKLSPEQFRKLFNSVMDENIIFSPLFGNENNQAKEGIHYLLQCPDLLQSYVLKNPVVFSYLPLECLILLEKNNIDLWNNDEEKGSAIEYILDNDNLDDENTLYFLNKYPQEIYDKFQQLGRKNNIQKYCHHLLLSDKLPQNNYKSSTKKI